MLVSAMTRLTLSSVHQTREADLGKGENVWTVSPIDIGDHEFIAVEWNIADGTCFQRAPRKYTTPAPLSPWPSITRSGLPSRSKSAASIFEPTVRAGFA